MNATRQPFKQIGYTNYSRDQVRKIARPEEINGAFVWWASGGDGWGAEPDRGVIPYAFAQYLPAGTIANPAGSGGHRYRSYGEAMRALKTALDGVPFDANAFENIGHGI